MSSADQTVDEASLGHHRNSVVDRTNVLVTSRGRGARNVANRTSRTGISRTRTAAQCQSRPGSRSRRRVCQGLLHMIVHQHAAGRD